MVYVERGNADPDKGNGSCDIPGDFEVVEVEGDQKMTVSLTPPPLRRFAGA